ncbi:ELWxxDGT repeat protein [Myxococcus eversor]|uniref:ELWxxDGT repeat protein n=1 Tax=Myxococcus eversor TaxID=2709661 RepID=UPI0013D4275E|nr:ELWxxDGT repeat protein [Myxococcus eversor]
MRRLVVTSLALFLGACESNNIDSASEKPPETQRAALTIPTFTLVKDLNAMSLGPAPGSVVAAHQRVYFGANHPSGSALYSLDPTTSVATPITTFPTSTAPTPQGVYRPAGGTADLLVFSAFEPGTGMELWLSDGTAAGTRRVADLNPGPLSSNATMVGQLGDALVFTAIRGSDFLLYRMDALFQVTRLSSEPVTGPPALLNQRVLFAQSSAINSEPWVSDGTVAGTQRLKDIHPTGSSSPIGFTVVGSRAIFFANNGTAGAEPWSTDGTPAGTSLLKDIQPGASGSMPFLAQSRIASVGSTVFFAANDGVHGEELWKTDGTSTGTVLVSDAVPGATGSAPTAFTGTPGRLFYTASQSTTGGEPWTSDGTSAGTFMLKDILPGANRSVSGRYVPFGAGALFFADDGIHGREPWFSNGQPSGTQLVSDLYPGSRGSADLQLLSVAGARAYFACTTPLGVNDLCDTDGTSAGTRRLSLPGPGTAPSAPTWLVATPQGRAFFAASDGLTGRELYVTDGTPTGTQRLTDLSPGIADGVTGQIYVFGQNVVFAGRTPEHGSELWFSDGTPRGTRMIRDIHPTAGVGALDGIVRTYATVHGNHFYFIASDGVTGNELWRTDGTENGTERLTDVLPGPAHSAVPDPAPISFGASLIFTAQDAQFVRSLYSLVPGSLPVRLTAQGLGVLKAIRNQNKVYFIAYPVSGTASTAPGGLWSTDGTPQGTVFITGGSFRDLIATGTEVALAGSGVLYASNGTPGNRRLVSLAGPSNLYDPEPPFVMVDGTLTFVGGNGTMGVGLWRSDLTRPGTTRLSSSATLDSYAWVHAEKEYVYFVADSATQGRELWMSDLTAANTRLAYDFAPGKLDGSPGRPIRINSTQLLLTANDGAHGTELWRIDEVTP